MSRQPRFVLPGQPQHVTQRGNHGDAIFACNDDCRFYLQKLGDACKRFACDLHAYVLMINHVHLLLTPQTEHSISKVMQSVGRYYVPYFNHQLKRTGTLWEGRYKAALLDSESYLLTCYRYIELNPVRVGMVDHPSDYPWSSYACNAEGKENPLISPHEVYLKLGENNEERQNNYRETFRASIETQELNKIRYATNKSWVLGTDHFKKQVEALTARQAQPKTKGGDRRSKQYRENREIN